MTSSRLPGKVLMKVMGKPLLYYLIKRIQNNTKRPIAIKSSTSELLDLIKKRSKVYSRSKYKINCEQLSKNEIVNKIIDIYENKEINS